jgi:predicted nucleic acid-binding protein
LTAPRAEQLIRAASNWVSGFEREPDTVAAFRAARRYGLSAYDAHYIALAEKLNVPCATSDARMPRRAAHIAMSIADAVARAKPRP